MDLDEMLAFSVRHAWRNLQGGSNRVISVEQTRLCQVIDVWRDEQMRAIYMPTLLTPYRQRNARKGSRRAERSAEGRSRKSCGDRSALVGDRSFAVVRSRDVFPQAPQPELVPPAAPPRSDLIVRPLPERELCRRSIPLDVDRRLGFREHFAVPGCLGFFLRLG